MAKLILNLPELKPTAQIKQEDRGVWNTLEGLDILVSAMNIEAAAMRLRDIKSVPHAWGHVVVFETALANPEHPGHQDAVSQWRALLAILALRSEDQVVRTESLGFEEDPGPRTSASFFRVVSEERLVSQISGNSWETVHLLYARVKGDAQPNAEVLLGMLSPSTIVAPARDFSGHDDLKHFWAHEAHKGLSDPLVGPSKLTPDQLEVCRLYAKDLLDALPQGDAANRISKLLSTYIEDLRLSGAKYHIGEWEKRDQSDLVPEARGLYRVLNHTWEDKSTHAVTDLEIGRIKVGKREIRIVLADPTCAATLDRESHLISVVGHTTLANLSQESFAKLRERAESEDILLLTPEDLLSSHLTHLDAFSASEGTHPTRFENTLLPIKPAALLLFKDMNELTKRLRITGSPTNPRVALDLRLTDHRGKSTTHTVVRTYGDHPKGKAPNGAGYMQKALPPSALAAWPDFQDPDWKWNYLYSCGAAAYESRSVVVTTGVSKDILQHDLTRPGFGEGRRRVQHCRERLGKWASADGPWDDVSGAVRDEEGGTLGKGWLEWLRIQDEAAANVRQRTLMRADWNFDAVLFRLPGEYDSVYAGLGLLPLAEKVSRQDAKTGGTAEIACDFGTSNTIVYAKVAGGAFEAARLEARLRRFNDFRDEDDGEPVDSDRDYAFMPVMTVEQPFATVMQRRNVAGGRSLTREWENADEPPLWRDYAFFDPDVVSLTENLIGSGAGNLVFDLKWGTGTEERKRMVRYLRHITMLSLADVIGDRKGSAPSEITWHFSHPVSMPKANEYRRMIKGHCLEGEREGRVKWHTESHAALAYFRQVESAETQTIVVLDIGGGSTDIALGTERKGPVWQHSIRLAGEELMTDFLLHNRSLLRKLRLAHVRRGGVFGDRRSKQAFMNPASDARFGQADRNAARAIINSAVFGDTFERQFAFISDTDEMKVLRVGGSLMMGGLCYFLGRQIEALIGRDADKMLDDRALSGEDLVSVRLCFGGKGSTLLREWEDDETIMSMKSYVTRVADDSWTEVFFSPEMKHEAAKGMLSDQDQGRIAGKFRLDEPDLRVVGIGAKLGVHDVAATSSLQDLLGIVGRDVTPEVAQDDFWSFVEAVGKQCGFRIEAKPVAGAAIVNKGTEAYKALVLDDKNGGGVLVEPPFIAMLRMLMQLVYEGKQVRIEWW